MLYAVSREAFDKSAQGERILELGQKYGIGILAAGQPDDSDTWEMIIDAIGHEPDPARLNRFLGDLPSENMKDQIMKWRS